MDSRENHNDIITCVELNHNKHAICQNANLKLYIFKIDQRKVGR